jgi:hypothetical protein
MGGNALKYAVTERKERDHYMDIALDVTLNLRQTAIAQECRAVVAFANKESFGDVDILVNKRYLPNDWIYWVQKLFNPDELVINRLNGKPFTYVRQEILDRNPEAGLRLEVPRDSVECSGVSFDFRGMQIDLIPVEDDDYEIANIYYAFNDLGNFMGRIADKMGFKYGWNGLTKQLMDGPLKYADLTVSRDPQQIFSFLGYDYNRFLKGFNTMEDVFQFAVSSRWFHRDLFLFENRNNKDRVRDAKRKSYNAFLQWLEDKPQYDRAEWHPYEGANKSEAGEIARTEFLTRSWHFFPDFQAKCAKAMSENVMATAAKQVWNGDLIGGITQLPQEEWRGFMNFCRHGFEAKQKAMSFNEWLLSKQPGEIVSFIRTSLPWFQKSKEAILSSPAPIGSERRNMGDEMKSMAHLFGHMAEVEQHFAVSKA